MEQGALSKPGVQWWLGLNSSTPTQSKLAGLSCLSSRRRCLVPHSAAEQNGVPMLREGGHRPRDARAFLSVCGLHSAITKIDHKKNTPHTHKKERPSFT